MRERLEVTAAPQGHAETTIYSTFAATALQQIGVLTFMFFAADQRGQIRRRVAAEGTMRLDKPEISN